MSSTLDPKEYRQVLGQYPTGVVVVTALGGDGEPLGMTVGSFTSVSLDPPLVAFLPDQSSSSWRALRESGDRFCVNVLSAGQEDVCRAVAVRKTDKFAGLAWHSSPEGNPVLDGAVAYIDCTVEVIHDAGDHHIVVGRVRSLDVLSTAYPLLFFRGGYGSFRPLSLATGDADLIEQLKLVDRARPHMDDLAHHFETEVTAICMVHDQLVLAAASGRVKSGVEPTRVGQRVAFTAPFGSVYAAYGSPEVRQHWLAELGGNVTPAQLRELEEVPDRVRERGYAITCGHENSAQLELASARVHEGEPSQSAWENFSAAVDSYNPLELSGSGPVELRSVSAPVFNSAGEVAFTLKLWGPPGEVERPVVDEHIERLLACAAAATFAIDGRAPGR